MVRRLNARMFIVDDSSFEYTNESMIVYVRPPGEPGMKSQTLFDIMADMIQIQKGDYIFLWKNRTKHEKSKIYGVYRAISKAYYVRKPDNGLPFRIHIEKAYDFENPIEEYEFLNCPLIRNPMWTVIGKKINGKPRGTPPLSPDEARTLITMLSGKNPNGCYIPPDAGRFIKEENELRFTYDLFGPSELIHDWNDIDFSQHPIFDENHGFHFEKAWEGIFNQEMVEESGRTFFKKLDIDVSKIIWHCNYLPYSIERSEIDYLMIESEDGEAVTKLYVVEFMISDLDLDHVKRSIMYSKWVSSTLAFGSRIIQPIVICSKCFDFNGSRLGCRQQETKEYLQSFSDENVLPVKIYSYSYDYGFKFFQHQYRSLD